jgi:hypothetical protein
MKTILKHTTTIIVIAVFCWMSHTTYAQKETELFIPLGQSPGISGKLSVMGKCGTITPRDSVVSFMQEPGGMKTCRMNYCTAIYLDRSKLKLTNTKGSLADIKPGSIIEVKLVDNKPNGLIEWIKVQQE